MRRNHGGVRGKDLVGRYGMQVPPRGRRRLASFNLGCLLVSLVPIMEWPPKVECTFSEPGEREGSVNYIKRKITARRLRVTPTARRDVVCSYPLQ